jgi:N-methylhydantoinase A
MRTVLLPLEAGTWGRVGGVFRDLAAEARTALDAMGSVGEALVSLAADMRYRGQSYELTVPVPDAVAEDASPAALLALFHATHAEQFGHFDRAAPVEVVSLRAAASRAAPPLPMPRTTEVMREAAPDATIRLFLGGAWQKAGLHRRAALTAGARFSGPAVVTQADCTVLVPPGWAARSDALGNLALEGA